MAQSNRAVEGPLDATVVPLQPDGVLVFKWNETQVRLSEVLALVPHAPLFGNTSGKKAGTHWLVFMKPNAKLT